MDYFHSRQQVLNSEMVARFAGFMALPKEENEKEHVMNRCAECARMVNKIETSRNGGICDSCARGI